jgi:AmiR/NasT family two-component response regulator
MSRPAYIPNFDGKRALILHRAHPVVDAISRQLAQLGISCNHCWPELTSSAGADADLMFFDADMGHDAQFPWAPGAAPMPAIALIGSEAPGRLAWTMSRGVDAHLLKPVGSGGVFTALVMASEAFSRRLATRAELDGLTTRLKQREVIAEATACLMLRGNLPAEAAYARLRRDAMAARLTIEAMAEQIVQELRGAHVRHRS